jgi:glycine cleavage system H protein
VIVPDLSAYRFTASHEWVHSEGGRATIGITDFAQSQLGDVIFIELPSVGTALKAGEKFGSIESVKAASDLYAPVSGSVVAANDALTENPERVNSDPYGEGWMVKLEGVAEGGVQLLDATAYEKVTAG